MLKTKRYQYEHRMKMKFTALNSFQEQKGVAGGHAFFGSPQ